MDGFTYTNIFDTKGIEYLIIIGFLLLIIPFWIIISKPVKFQGAIKRSLGMLRFDLLNIPRGLFYSRNHTWAHLEKSGNAKIGVDDLLVHLTGPVEVDFLKSPGEMISKGDMVAELRQDGKSLGIRSPLTGEIITVNGDLKSGPGALGEAPYGAGWICELRPENWIEEVNTCLFADDSVQWIRKEVSRFKDFIAAALQKHHPETSMLVLQEGGELVDNPLSVMPAEIWNDFQESFLELDG